MKLDDDALNKTLSFETVLGVKYNNLKFTDNLSALTLIALGQDPEALHQQYREKLPPGTPDDYRLYRYAKFEQVSGGPIFLGIPWVKEDSIEENEHPNYGGIFRSITAAQLDSLRTMITASGIEDFELYII